MIPRIKLNAIVIVTVNLPANHLYAGLAKLIIEVITVAQIIAAIIIVDI